MNQKVGSAGLKVDRMTSETPKSRVLEGKGVRSGRLHRLRPGTAGDGRTGSGPLYRSYLESLMTASSKNERAAQLGLTPKRGLSFECNQSFPKFRPPLKAQVSEPGFYADVSLSEKSLSDFRASHSAQIPRTYVELREEGLKEKLVECQVLAHLYGATQQLTYASSIPRSQKLEEQFTEQLTLYILIANDTACKLFALDYRHLVGRKLTELLLSREMAEELEAEANLLMQLDRSTLVTKEGNFRPSYGKLIDIVDSSGNPISVSLWLYPLERQKTVTPKRISGLKKKTTADLSETLSPAIREQALLGSPLPKQEGRCLILLEPVDRVTASCVLGPHGRIFTADSQLACMFGYSNESDILGTSISELIPCITLPGAVEKECDRVSKNEALTGRTKTGTSFPLTVQVTPSWDESGDVLFYDLKFFILLTIGGLLTVLENGDIHSCNENFTMALLGKSEKEVVDKPIVTVIPDVYRDICQPDKENSLDDFKLPEDLENASENLSEMSLRKKPSVVRRKWSPCDIGKSSEINFSLAERPQASSTPAVHLKGLSIEGIYSGFAQHKDGFLLAVTYQIKKLILIDGQGLFCVWLLYKADVPIETPDILVRGESTESESDIDVDLSRERTDPVAEGRRASELTLLEMIRGGYSDDYETLQQVGTGAFGAVRLAARKTDGLLVITKFICKEKVLPDSWVRDKDDKKVPIEIHLLTSLRHPNIVEVLDVFENDVYYQMVMGKHGSGMDLFEFIDRQPNMDESLMSYIFRQIVSAVAYLHGLGIVHRDVKDENVIINEEFKCKLIDFGSAAYYNPGEVFSTFCGTMEYCSPEVLLGNKYVGPELEMWSIGILLFTLAFGENPFRTAHETIEAELHQPWDVSEGLSHLICWLLHPNPRYRASVEEVKNHWWVTQNVDISKYQLSKLLGNCEPHDLKPPKYVTELLRTPDTASQK